MRCLFLGYNQKKTEIIRLLKKNNCKVTNISRKLKKSDVDKNDIYISFGYRKIISRDILKNLKRPIINLHLSYLPFNRGAHPNFWSFIDQTKHGVTIHEIDEGIDTGPIIYQKQIRFNFKKNKNLTFKNTYQTLFNEIELLFKKNIKNIISKKYKKNPQKKQGTFHRKKDLPKKLKNWNSSIYYYKKKIKK